MIDSDALILDDPGDVSDASSVIEIIKDLLHDWCQSYKFNIFLFYMTLDRLKQTNK